MTMEKRLSRRTVLRGLGGVIVGLPFLEEMMAKEVAAAPGDMIPTRAFNIFFGLGMPTPLQADGYDGVMEPLGPLRDKLLIMRGVDQVRADANGLHAHFDGASGAFTAAPPDGQDKAGGPSIDQLIRGHVYPDGLPAGVVPALLGGTFFRRSRTHRYIHSWNENGVRADQMQESPAQLFTRVFGGVTGVDPNDARKQRIKRSVLDSVLDQYQHLSGENSPLGSRSKVVLDDTLTRVREYEQRAFQMEMDKGVCQELAEPPASQLKHGAAADPNGEGIDITLDELTGEWRLLSDIYALAIQCDRARFGCMTFLAAGERIRLTGDYVWEGQTRFTFDDSGQLGRTGSAGCSHEWWHKFREDRDNEEMRWHLHMKMRELAYFMSLLDGPESVEANGKTILENTLITISTESGDGRHNDVRRELSGIFHACTSGGGRLKTGQIMDLGAEGVDVYNTMPEAYGVSSRPGPSGRMMRRVESILA